jgi:N-acetylglucosaminyldiphosphoundecaprenol N-acetyl-beta-D-mannosaminyltransferase
LLGASLPERVAGSDLVPAVFDRCNTIGGLRVFLLGGRPGVGARAATAIQNLWSEVHVVGHLSPSFGFENDPHECKQVAEAINAQRPDFLVVGLGAPKQELWLHRFQHQISARVAVAAGATIDFLAGEQVRAPRAVQKMGLEWLFRIATDPTRLARRYLHDGVAFPCLLARELARQYLSAPPIAEHCSETSRFRGV